MSSKVEISTKNTIENGPGIKGAKFFLRRVIELFAEESFSFYKIWDEFPFTYTEKQVNSLMIPAIYRYCKNIFLEQPFKKKKGNQRFLDIVTTKGNNIYLIELKHSWNSKNEGIAKYTDTEWEKAIEQISDINKRSIGSYYNYKDFNVFKIALMIMPTFVSPQTKHQILNMTASEYVNELFMEYDRYLSNKNKANFIGVIKIKNPMEYEHKHENVSRIYPFISFIARIERL